MRLLVVGTGGVGSAFAVIARRRSFFDSCALADYDEGRAAAVVASLDDGRFSAHRVDASSPEDVARLAAPEVVFMNVNTPEDLLRARSIACGSEVP